MIEFFIYPVSAVLKFWHWFLHSGLGISTSTAWLLSIFGLIFTVRTIIAPTAWLQLKSARMSQLVRPKIWQLQREYETRTDAEADKWKLAETKRIQKEGNYNMWAGCLPMFIQIPVFLGLYQVLLRMARPKEGLGGQHHAIGFLTPEDVSDFITVRVLDVPLPAYVRMSDAQLFELGTNRNDVVGIVFPVVLAACIFTTVNMIMSTIRSFQTADWNSKIAVSMNKLMISFVILAPLMLFFSAFTAPVPVAIILYWFGGNLWTMGQFFVLNYLLYKRHPLSPEFLDYRNSSKEKYKAERAEKLSHKRTIRKKRLLTLVQPHKAREHHSQIKELRIERRRKKLEANAEVRANAKKRKEARREANEAKREERRAQRAQREQNVAEQAEQPRDQIE